MIRVFAIVGLVAGLMVGSLALLVARSSAEVPAQSQSQSETQAQASGLGRVAQAGLVFVDDDADGVRDPSERPRAGVVVSNGQTVVRTGPDGRYTLPLHGEGFVSITCPSDARCPLWFRRASDPARDFGVVPAPEQQDGFFFVHMSDVHAYASVTEMAGLSPADRLPWWLPKTLTGWLILQFLDGMYPDASSEDIAAALREVVSKHRDVSGSWDATVVMDYIEVAGDPASGIIVPGVEIPRAFAEVASLRPTFVVNTGDMILEGNGGEPDAVERWYDYYRGVAAASGLDIYETIGNNELAGTDNEDFPPSHPLYGKVLFRRTFGPTHYSFDYGPYHFVAVDTHRPEFEPGEEEEWSFDDMEPDVRDWLDADLANANGRTIVVLNHEPYHNDPTWDFDRYEPAHDEGLFAKHGVSYVLAGHIHKNGFQDAPPEGGVTHITTGAMSGLRWSMPASFDARGYRLVQARDGRLYSAWKDLGNPLLGFVEPRGDAAIHPASTHAQEPNALQARVDVVAVAADVDAPFDDVRLFLSSSRGDEELPLERWSDYFLHASLDASRISAGASLTLRATDRDGASHETRLGISQAGTDPAP
jgi:hypothetical protein